MNENADCKGRSWGGAKEMYRGTQIEMESSSSAPWRVLPLAEDQVLWIPKESEPVPAVPATVSDPTPPPALRVE